MDWAKKNYDTLILGVCTALFVFNAAFLYFITSGFINSLPTASTTPPSKSKAITEKPIETSFLEEAKAITEKPVLWNEKSPSNVERGNLFISRLFILKGDKLIDPIEGQEQLHPPITNAWLIKFGLNYSDSNVKDQDADGDGFTNLEEFIAKSDPKNKASHPSLVAKLRFLKLEPKSFPIVFKGDAGDQGTDLQFSKKGPPSGSAKFNSSHAGGPISSDGVIGTIEIDGVKYEVSSYKKKEYPFDLPPDEKNNYDMVLAKINTKADQDVNLKRIEADRKEAGEALKNAETSLASLKKSKASKDLQDKALGDFSAAENRVRDVLKSYNEEFRSLCHSIDPFFEKYLDTPKKDLSEVVLKNSITSESLTLIKDTPILDPTSFGEFFNVLTNEKFRLQKGEEFTIKPDVNTKLKLIDISSTEAKIQDVATGTTSTLSKSSSPAP